MLRNVVFIINPIFGVNRSPAKIVRWIGESWGNSGIEFEILKTGHRGHGIELAKDAVVRGVDMVVAVGGDGTINEIGQGLIGTKTALGVIPAGSGNGFARNLQIPLNQRQAIEVLKSPRIKQIDVGKINEYYFFNVAGAGLDAIISHHFDAVKMRGPVPYFVIGVRQFIRFKPQPMVIELPGLKIHRSPLLISFANLPMFGINATIAPNAKPDDGLIDLCILNPVKFGRAVKNLPKLFSGRIDQLPEMEIYQTNKVRITRLVKGPIHTDGDPHPAAAVLDIEILPKKLNLALPG